ncbi:MAG: PAS domain S-box protein [Deltaproteobacteria bacterium]|nr:PAS domain S-box protein [Deltaproteobacteria bacterium]
MTHDQSQMQMPPARSFLRAALPLLLILTTVIAVAGYLVFSFQKQSIKEQVHKELRAVADLKVSQITGWRAERIDDAVVLGMSPFLSRAFERWLKDGAPGDDNRTNILQRPEALMQTGRYSNIFFIDVKQTGQLSTRPAGKAVGDSTLRLVPEVIKTGRTLFSPLHRMKTGTKEAVFLDLLSPLLITDETGPRPVGVLVFRIDPASFLFPLIQSWPTPSNTAETLLIERQGAEAVYLNELRFRKNTALKLRLPATEAQLPAAMAARGIEGAVEGLDYRGVPVLAAIRKIPDSPWFIVAKIDQVEAYAAIRENARLITGFTLVIIIAVTMWVLSRWRRHNLAGLHGATIRRLQAEESFRLLCEQSLQGIVISLGSPSRLVYVNPKWTEIFGYPAEVALSFSEEERWRLIHPDDREMVQTYHNDRLAGKEVPPNYRIRILRPDGQVRGVEVFAGPVNYQGQKAIQVAYIDITERNQAEEALLKSEERYRLLFNHAPIGIVYYSHNGVILDLNEKITEILGVPREQAIGFNVLENLRDEQMLRAIKDALSGNIGYYEGDYVSVKGGKTTSIRGVFKRIPCAQGDLFGAIGLVEDMTAQTRAEHDLAEEKERLAVTLESIGEGVISTDLAGRVTLINKAAESMTGWSQEQAAGLPLSQVFNIIHGVTRKRRENPVSQIIKTGRVITPIHHTVLINQDGREMIIDDNAAPILDQSNALIGVVLVFRDISAQTQAEEDRLKLEAQLRQAQKMEAIGTLAGGIAHDFNNILGSIFGYTQLALEDAKIGAVNPDFLGEIFKAAKRARDLVRQILTISRQTEQEKKPFEPASIVKESIKLIRASLPANIIIQSEITTAGATILGDPTQFHQVLINLCTNAAHAMADQGGTLSITLTGFYLDTDSAAGYLNLNPGPYIKLTVRDTGHGIDGPILDKIFDPFFTTKEFGKGTGMGLAIVQSIVKNHGGAISVYSRPSGGTTFNILLPAASDKPELIGDIEETIPKGTESVLLVDDEPGLAETGKIMLERLGYKVTAKIGAVEALGAFMAHPDEFDLLITDMAMPQMTGDKLAQEIMRWKPDLPVILCTGYSEAINEKTAAEMGVSGFLMKPIDITRLAKLIRQVLEK